MAVERSHGAWIICALLFIGDASFAADGKALYTSCIGCHGARGEGLIGLNAPALAGQDAAYLERQLRAYRIGARGKHKSDTFGAQMRAAAAALQNDEQIKKVAAYAASLPRTTPTARGAGDVRKGGSLYHGKCGACHGGAAEGNAALKAPRLAGLDAAYLKRQFAYFRDGVRGVDPQDVPGRQMAMMAKTLAGERDLDDVVAFIHEQGRKK